MLVYGYSKREGEQKLATLAIVKALNTDFTKADQVDSLNETLRKYIDMYAPPKKKRTREDVKTIMEDFKQSFPKLLGKLKNNEKA